MISRGMMMNSRNICKKCGGWCCVNTLKMIADSERDFHEFMGHKVRILKDGRYLMVIPSVCKYWDKECKWAGK